MTQTLDHFLARFVRIEARERRAVFTAFALMFCVLGGYFSVRPVRETFGTIMGDTETAKVWTATAIAAIAIVPIYGWLVGRFARQVLLPAIYSVVAVGLMVTAAVTYADPENYWNLRFYYVGISVCNLLLVSVFWSFLLELFTSEQTKRLFGFIAAGGTTGALVGPFITERSVEYIGNSGVLLFGATLFIGAVFLQRALLRVVDDFGTTAAQSSMDGGRPAAQGAARRGTGGNPFAGILIVLRSPYLLGIALFVFFISTANTLLYFEQQRLVTDMFESREARTQMFARIDFIVQSLTVLSQLFLTGYIAKRIGVAALLTVVPVLMIGAFLLLAYSGVFLVLAGAMILRRWGEYAFIRPGREMLWSRLDTETKYKAKNFVDVPVYRFSDAVVARLQDALKAGGTSPGDVALMGAAAAVLWAINGFLLGRAHDKADKADKPA
jgi:AAA family ATP:ADP antiporter